MDRKKFLTAGGVLAATSILPTNSVLAQHYDENGLDKLTDSNGNFQHLPLTYNKNFLEPQMDEETVYLDHTFHHDGAVKAANTDLQKIRKAMDEIIWKLLITGQRNYLIIFHPMYCILFSGQT